jgi:hypothetical protein
MSDKVVSFCTCEGKSSLHRSSIYDSNEYKLLSVAYADIERKCPKENYGDDYCKNCIDYIERYSGSHECLLDVLSDVITDFVKKEKEEKKEFDAIDEHLYNKFNEGK